MSTNAIVPETTESENPTSDAENRKTRRSEQRPSSGSRNDDWKRSDRNLVERLKKTQREVKRVDLFATLTALATFGCFLFLVGVVCDHWIFAQGFSTRGRILYFGLTTTVLVAYFVYRLIPLLRYRINPLFAAQVLEENQNQLKNSVINWFLLRKELKRSDRSSNETLQKTILEGVVRQANQEIATVPDQMTVDHAPLIRWGIAFVVVLFLFSGYSVFSPKNSFQSVARIILPVAEIKTPISVRFIKIEPGNVQVFQNDRITVRTEISGVGDSPVYLSYSTLDGRFVDQKIEMVSLGGNLFELEFPTEAEGLTESLNYQIVVGNPGRSESRSDSFLVEVRPAITFEVERTTLRFPEYSKTTSQTFYGSGDVAALEGSVVELTARANVPLKQALFVPDRLDKLARTMKIDPADSTCATFAFPLEFQKNRETDAPTQSFSSYELRCSDENGNKNRTPVVYQVVISRDQPPTVDWRSPNPDDVNLPSNGSLNLKIAANDPDFGLSSVRLRFALREKQGEARSTRKLPRQFSTVELLTTENVSTIAENSTNDSPREASLSFELVPERFELQVGDEVEYWAEASDVKTPEANSAATEKRSFIVSKSKNQNENVEGENSGGDSQAEGGKSEQKEDGDQSGESANNESENVGDSQNNDSGDGESNDESGRNESDQNQQNSSEQDGTSDSEKRRDESSQNQSSESGKSGQNQKGGNESGREQTAATENESQQNNAENGPGNSPTDQNSSKKDGNADSGSQRSDSDASERSDKASQSGGGDSESENPSDDSSSENSDSPPKNGTASEQPIDPDANPGEAFEKILDQMKKKERESSASPSNGSATSDDANARTSNGSGDSSDKNSNSTDDDSKPSQENDSTQKTESNENRTASSSNENASRPKKTAEMPEASDDRPANPDSERVQADSVERLDPGVRRNQGEIDPQTNNYMTTNPDSNDQLAENSVDSNANIVDDPDNPVAGLPTDGAGNSSKNRFSDAPDLSPVRPNESLEVMTTDDLQNGGSEDSSAGDSSGSNGLPNDFNLDPNAVPENAALGSANPDGNPPLQANDSSNPDGSGSPSGEAAPQGGNPSKNSNDPSDFSDSPQPQNDRQGTPTRRGTGGFGTDRDVVEESRTSIADSPNLRFTEEATSLALEYLEDQLKNGPDQELLDELGWDEQRLADFLEKWKEMKKNAQAFGENSPERQYYLESLNDLGLRNSRSSDQILEKNRSEQFRDATTGTQLIRVKPPAAFEERFRVYHQGVSTKK